MKEKSRIRFNPVTGEIEVEGSEAFVKTYFQKLQRLLSQPPESKEEKKPRAKAGAARKSKKAKAKPGKKRAGKETQMDAVVSLVRGAEGGSRPRRSKRRRDLPSGRSGASSIGPRSRE